MTVILQDPVRTRDPSAGHAFPASGSEAKTDLRPARTLAEELLARFRAGGTVGETSFELESHGGYARTVTGTVAYLDLEANTFMVRARDGKLVRVPLRDIRSAVPVRSEGGAEVFFDDPPERSDAFFSKENHPGSPVSR
jgi:hypothetical protein